MSKYSNVNPGQYKVAGRERPGDGLIQEREKRQFRQQESSVRRGGPESATAMKRPAAARKKKAPGRRRTTPESLLMRSAAAVGRTLGGLQREIERTARRFTGTEPVRASAASQPGSKAGAKSGTRKRASAGTGSRRRTKRAPLEVEEPRSPSGDEQSE